ncbi:hypothetical protein [Desulfosediminicola flagellatus]|uniref:hypothetical protein n=1 Tax=Desulfosediminicola flagellatus TaxID=2569541 RepID=UPI0010ABD56E|nr:hypothetical protein [Desulfosediminicola flagellatus]
MRIGPTRLVLIRSGKYEYGEIELLRPLHLIGPNNVGKTSLISTMQFLYIDRQDKMHFSRDLQQTRKYYFPDPNSYILYECLTPTGYRVLGVHGLGPVKGFDFERFSYTGKFKLEDFVDAERKVRSNDEIRSGLSDREYTQLAPSHLRAALTGIGENKGVRLELLPMRDRGGYKRFRKVFSNLLRLAHVSQDDLKRFLYEIYENDFQQAIIDLQSSYSKHYKLVRDSANEVKDLKAVEGDISQALLLATERDALRSELPQYFAEIQVRVEQIRSENVLAKEEIQKERYELTKVVEKNTAIQDENNKELRVVNQNLGVVQRDLTILAKKKEDFSSFILDFEESAVASLKQEVEQLGFKLKSSNAEPVRRVKGRIDKNAKELHKQEQFLATIADSTASYMKARYTDEEIARIFQLFNHDLLGLAVGDGEIEVHDPERLDAVFKELLQKIDENAYSDDVLRILFPPSMKPDLKSYSDPKIIAEVIKDLKAELEKDRVILQDAEQYEELQKKKEHAEKTLKTQEKRVHDYLALQEECKNEKAWEKELKKLEEQRDNLEKEQGELTQKTKKLEAQVRECQGRLSKIEDGEKKLTQKFRFLSVPNPIWTVDEEITEFPERIEELFQLYEDMSNREKRTRDNLADKLDTIESKTYSRVKGETEEETLNKLAEELEALGEKEEAVEKLWSGLTANLKTAIKNMLKDLDTLKSKVEALNRQLGKVSVSNLSRLKLILKENHQLVPRLRKVSAQTDMPLFAGLTNSDEALDFVGDFLKKSGKIELLHLFELNFEVTSGEGVSQRYTKLETIESNGTTITIKVLINIMLLRGLMDGKRKCSIPFYLDEASSLDRENVQSIVDQSLKLGFTPILASPEAMDVADNLYFLRDTGGKLHLGEDALVRLEREPEKVIIE